MNREILDFIKQKRVGVLAVEMLDGSPHAATVHYANSENPLVFYFETDRGYRKTEPLLANETTRASLVIGFDEKEMKTLQIDGTVQLLKESQQEIFQQIYLGKFPEKAAMSAKHDLVFFALTPSWWRYTDWTKSKGKTILSSTGNV